VELVITKLDDGQVRVAEIGPTGKIIVHEWVRKRFCCSFAFADLRRPKLSL